MTECWAQDRKPLGPFTLRKCSTEARKGFSLLLACPGASDQRTPCPLSIFSACGQVNQGGIVRSLRYLCNNSFSKWSLQKLVSHTEELIQQARVSCQDAQQPNTREEIHSSTTIKSHMLSIRLLGKSSLHLTHNPQSEALPLKKKKKKKALHGQTLN